MATDWHKRIAFEAHKKRDNLKKAEAKIAPKPQLKQTAAEKAADSKKKNRHQK